MFAPDKLLLLFERPLEPIFTLKRNKYFIRIPESYVPDEYKTLAAASEHQLAANQTGVEIITVNQDVPELNLSPFAKLSRKENFSVFLPLHCKLASDLIKIFLEQKAPEDVFRVGARIKDFINPYLFVYSLSVALLHREDTKELRSKIPSYIHMFPGKFFNASVLSQVREQLSFVAQGFQMSIKVPVDYTANNMEEEHRLAYFREDLGLNLHHWHWHLVYPFCCDEKIVNKDRRGELFYYMHQQIIARYNIERLCNNMTRVEKLIDWASPLKEAYFPKLNIDAASRPYPSRVENQKMSSLNRKDAKVDLFDLMCFRDRLYEAIDRGFAINTEGNKVYLTENEGIDILGNMVEASILSVNPALYGNIHNNGHVVISCVHDPKGRYMESFGVMGDSTTAMRDPLFYRWHAFIDDIFQRFKVTLPPYTTEQLTYPDIVFESVSVTDGGDSANVLHTHWQKAEVVFKYGLDFESKDPVAVEFRYLDHNKFSYSITVANNSGSDKKGTCRIFLAPRYDESGNELSLHDQRLLFIEMDRFIITLKQGRNNMIRRCTESSVTIPFERTFFDPDSPDEDIVNICGCGWPHHLLLPKGTAVGYPCELFFMISDYEQDNVVEAGEPDCDDGSSYCGILNRKYPDKRAMGFPFDRQISQDRLEDFLTPNMISLNVSIKHVNVEKPIPPKNN